MNVRLTELIGEVRENLPASSWDLATLIRAEAAFCARCVVPGEVSLFSQVHHRSWSPCVEVQVCIVGLKSPPMDRGVHRHSGFRYGSIRSIRTGPGTPTSLSTPYIPRVEKCPGEHVGLWGRPCGVQDSWKPGDQQPWCWLSTTMSGMLQIWLRSRATKWPLS